ncbi:MAG: hypothetical protein NTV89_15985 [Proteobacteria bacterium]|nr:hypothetical protein [Pseudomonadota bacterium]
MKKEALKKDSEPGVARRSFMKIGGLSFLSMMSLGGAKKLFAGEYQDTWKEFGYDGNIPWYWNEKGYPAHKTVNVSKLSEGTISARVDKRWRQFKITEPDINYKNFESNGMVNVYNKLLEGVVAMFGGVYCPTIISYGGIPRGDSKFTLNGACKFMFPCPKESEIQGIIDGLKQHASDPKARREWFRDKFANKDLWDFTRLVSRDETVVKPGEEKPDTLYRETHTFRNLMENPLAVILFVSNTDNQSYELRTIGHYVHKDDEAANSYERKIAEFINTYANVSHGLNANFPAIIFYTIEEFNNSMEVGKEGARVAKLVNGVKNMYARMPWNKSSIG